MSEKNFYLTDLHWGALHSEWNTVFLSYFISGLSLESVSGGKAAEGWWLGVGGGGTAEPGGLC